MRKKSTINRCAMGENIELLPRQKEDLVKVVAHQLIIVEYLKVFYGCCEVEHAGKIFQSHTRLYLPVC